MGRRYPATTRTQSLGGLSTWAHVLPLHVLKHEEDARPTTTWTQSLGGPFVEYKGCHSSDPLFTTYPGGMSVIQVKDIQPFKCRQTYLVPILLQDWRFIDKIESKMYTKADLIRSMQTTQIMHDFVILPMHTSITQTSHTFTHLRRQMLTVNFF